MKISNVKLQVPNGVEQQLLNLKKALLEEFGHTESDHFFCVLDARENTKKVYRRRFCFHPRERRWRKEEHSVWEGLLSHIEETHPHFKGLYEALELRFCTGRNGIILEIFVAKEETVKFFL